MTNAEALNRVLSLVGGQSNLARSLNVKPQAVQQWVTAGRVPPKRVLEVEAAVEGQVTRYQLRRDIYGAPPSIESSERFNHPQAVELRP